MLPTVSIPPLIAFTGADNIAPIDPQSEVENFTIPCHRILWWDLRYPVRFATLMLQTNLLAFLGVVQVLDRPVFLLVFRSYDVGVTDTTGHA